MAEKDYTYKGMIAKTWDLFRGDTSNWPDRFLFKEIIEESGQPALDVGCGTGRLLLDYLQQGIDIDGVDNSPEMLDICREKAARLGLQPSLYLQTMESLDLPRRYRTIIVPSSSFQLVLDQNDARMAMDRLFHHLQPGGTLVMPFMILWTEKGGTPLDPQDWYLLREKENPEDGTILRRWIRNRYDLDAQLEHTRDRYEVVRDGEVIHTEEYEHNPGTRWYTQEQAVNLYRAAGFTGITLLKEFTREPATPDDSLFTILGTRP